MMRTDGRTDGVMQLDAPECCASVVSSVQWEEQASSHSLSLSLSVCLCLCVCLSVCDTLYICRRRLPNAQSLCRHHFVDVVWCGPLWLRVNISVVRSIDLLRSQYLATRVLLASRADLRAQQPVVLVVTCNAATAPWLRECCVYCIVTYRTARPTTYFRTINMKFRSGFTGSGSVLNIKSESSSSSTAASAAGRRRVKQSDASISVSVSVYLFIKQTENTHE